jgi:penicillin-binding protein 2
MTEPAIIFNEVNERQGVFHRRAFLLGGVAGAGLLALSGRLLQLQVIETGRYKSLSESNQYNFRMITPPRGRIVDRNGVELASNRPNFRLLLLKDQTKDPKATLALASQVIDIPPDRQRQLLREIADGPRFVPVSLADDLTWEEFASINVRAPELPGLQPDMGEARVYPFGGAFAHVVGYVSKVTQADLDKAGDNPDPLLLHPGFRIGKQGVEKALDLQLRGKPGGQKVEVDSRGRVVREDPAGDVKPVPGDEVVLTLDADIQNRALEVFGEESGAAVMMDCRTGDVLCLMSAPSFDANKFVKGLSAADYHALAQYDRKPLFNKALTATYPPGSTFKTMVALAALEHDYDPKTVHVCNKVWFWGGRPWHCDEAHGAQDLHSAIATSCDVYFYQCALAVGPDRIAEVARKFGLGELHDMGLPLNEQKPGLVPDTAYKRRAFPHDPVWHAGETPSMGIGQGYTNVNALQLCVMASRLASGGKALQPRLIHSIGGAPQPSGAAFGDLPFKPENIDFIRTGMSAVTGATGEHIAHATGALFGDLGLGVVKMAGKTGTAQAHGYGGGTGVHDRAGAWAQRDHSWFIAFAPYDAPRYALSVLVEHGGFGGSAAVPRAREIMRVALLKDPEVRARIERPMPMPALPETAPGVPVDGDEPPPPTDRSGQPA